MLATASAKFNRSAAGSHGSQAARCKLAAVPLIRCSRCSRAYEIPDETALRLPRSVARCDCGEWIGADRERLIKRVLGDGPLVEIDLRPFLVAAGVEHALELESDDEPFDTGDPVHVRVVAQTSGGPIDAIFTLDSDPLWIGKGGSHLEFDDPDLSIRHCLLERRGSELWLRDADSHTGTFLDGEPIAEVRVPDGMHIVRAGVSIICIESSSTPGMEVRSIAVPTGEILDGTAILRKRMEERRQRDAAASAAPKQAYLICLEGPAAGNEFLIPAEGLVVGREGSVRVSDDYLSRKHFSFARDAGGTLRVKDLGSRNGTFLNTLPARNTKIRPGDEIRAGNNRFRVEER
jgi:pSer/pThr/pTyr-binding forkhead associated (FHA) protein